MAGKTNQKEVANTPNKAAPKKEVTKTTTTPTKNTPTKQNNKRKEPEVKENKEIKEKTNTNNIPNKSNKSNNNNNNNNNNNKNEEKSKLNVNKDNKKQPQQKKQKTEEKPKTVEQPKKVEEPKKQEQEKSKPVEEVKKQEQPSFSIFESLKKLDTSVKTNTTTPTITNNTPNKKNNKKVTNNKNENNNTEDQSMTTATSSDNTDLLKAFSQSNQYSEPNIKEINEKVETTLKEIKANSPKEKERKEQREKTKLIKQTEKQREQQNPRTVFVSNIKLENANEKEIKSVFSKFGTVESIRFRSIPISSIDANRKETFIKKQFHEKRETCNAYVVFKVEDDAKKAVQEMNGKELFGKHIRVDLASHKPSKESDSKCVFVGNVPYEIEEEELFLLFDSNFKDQIVSVRIVRDQHTNIGKGFGYVNFKSESAAKDAIDLKTISIGKREIRIFPTKENPKKGKTIKEKKKSEKRRESTRVKKTK